MHFRRLAAARALLGKEAMKHVAVLLLVLGGCFTDPPPRCLATGAAEIADIQYRNPANGQCQSFGQPCDNSCGLCPGVALPDWAMCGGACDSLTETQCLATPSCHAAYQDDSAAQ